MIVFTNTAFHFRGKEVLKELTFSLNDQEHVAITGPTASGKSMLLRALAGKIQPYSGSTSFVIAGEKIDGHSLYKHALFISFNDKSHYFDSKNHFYQQRYSSLEDESSTSITVDEFLKTTLPDIAHEQISEALSTLHIASIRHRKLIQLSSGQRKKLALVQVVVNPPEILLLDDPYMGLDAESRADLNGILEKIATGKQSQIIISAKNTDLPSFVTKQVDLHNVGSTKTVKEKFPAKHQPKQSYDTLVRFEDVSIKYGATVVLQNINFQLSEGNKMALIGNNGSGKSTLLSLIYADHPQAYANNIILFDKKRGSGESIWDIKRNIGYSSPELHLYFPPALSGKQVIGTGFFAALTLTRRLTSKQEQRIIEFTRYFGLEHVLDRAFGALSTGEQRTLLLIRALISPRPLVLLDEPYQGMDDQIVRKANQLIDYLFRSEGSLLFITHYEDEIPSCISNTMYLSEGEMVMKQA